MGCASSQPAGGGGGGSACPDSEKKIKDCPEVKLVGKQYLLSQHFAIVRHGDRLDSTPEWETYEGRQKWCHDTPLVKPDGFKRARETGEALKKSGAKFSKIFSSPYLRCAQTASEIAQVLNVPVQFFLGVGEIFDDIAMKGKKDGLAVHRTPKELEAELKVDFPSGVTWKRTPGGSELDIQGVLPMFPESYEDASIRFSYHFKQLLQHTAAQQRSIVIVTHADAVSTIYHMMNMDVNIKEVKYAGYLLGNRQVPVYDKPTQKALVKEPVFRKPEQWTLTSGGVKALPIVGKRAKTMKDDRLDMLKKVSDQFATGASFYPTPTKQASGPEQIFGLRSSMNALVEENFDEVDEDDHEVVANIAIDHDEDEEHRQLRLPTDASDEAPAVDTV
jgi:broad specificity phosphatase PhoE